MPDTSPEPPVVLAYLGLGGNLGDVRQSFTDALHALDDASSGTIRCSRLYSTSPWGIEAQPDFLNMVVELPWASTASDLIKLTQQVERSSGRIRAAEHRWGPRPLDIDILIFADLKLDGGLLTVPHPRLHERLFVLTPLLDLLPPATQLPRYELSLGELHNSCSDTGEIHPLSDGPWDEWRETQSPT
jgi:2-amino-4-hydroxy-6-hydroxymethyldihydropteridine diphosphokinase